MLEDRAEKGSGNLMVKDFPGIPARVIFNLEATGKPLTSFE